MVFNHEVQQVGCLLFNAGVQFLAAKGLVDGGQGALEPVILLQSEQAAELPFHGRHNADRLRILKQVVGGLCGGTDGEGAVVVTVQRGQGLGVIGDD